MQHSASGVRRAPYGLRRYGRPAWLADGARDTRQVLGFWLPVALDDRMWHPDRLR
jgi:hypothetical protein